MEIPFCYGKIVKDDDFTDRKESTIRLYNNFKALTNTTIISPRRWGKSSLVNKAAEELVAKDKDFIAIRLDAFNVKSQEDFLRKYAEAVSNAFTTQREILKFIERYMPKFGAEIVFGHGPVKVLLKIEPRQLKENVDEIIDLPQRLAEKTKKKVVICIDEFQIVADFKDTLSFQRLLRSHWQTHDSVAYCLYGSKYNLMTKLIGEPNMPLYKFGDIIYLDRISTEDWISYIVQRFSETGKRISEETAGRVVELTENHSYYVQQLSQLSWISTKDKCNDAIVDEAFGKLLEQLEILFMPTMDGLTATQVEYLRAVLDGVKNWASTETYDKYRMGTAPNVKNIQRALEKKEITTRTLNGVEIQDPVFKYWLKNIYFKD